MAKTQFLAFTIYLTDAERVKELQANPPGQTSLAGTEKAIIRAPRTGAAVEFAPDNGGVTLPLIGYEQAPPAVVPPALGGYIQSDWFAVSNPDWEKQFPTDVATFTKKSGGWFGIPLLFGTTTRYYWRGVFAYRAPLSTDNPLDPGTARGDISQRRWLDPFPCTIANTPAVPTGDATLGTSVFRGAGRWPDTMGVGLRGLASERQRIMTDYGGGATRGSWERLYIRLRKVDSGDRQFWRCESVAPGAGVKLLITPGAKIKAKNHDIIFGDVDLGESPVLVVGQWYKFDILVRYTGDGNAGNIRLFLDGVEFLNATPGSGAGLARTENHLNSFIGTTDADGWSLEFDIGFWMNALYPPDLSGIDWRNGSRAVMIRATGFTAGHANWTGEFRRLAQMPARPTTIGSDILKSTTALAELQVTTDAALTVDTLPGALGAACFIVVHQGYKGTLAGQIGFKIGAAPRVLAAIPSGAAGSNANPGWSGIMHRPTGIKLPGPITPLELHRIKGDDAVESGTAQLVAVAEVLGTFGDEDYDPILDPDVKMKLPFLGQHNAPYPRTPWARASSPPISPVVIHSGTYAGNGTGQDLAFRSPVNWLWIRRVTDEAGTAKGVRWFTTRLGAGSAGLKSPLAFMVPDALIDPNFPDPATEDAQSQQTLVRIAGIHPEVNRAGDTYHYIAVSDPGQRFMLNGAFGNRDVNLPATHPLIDTKFVPDAAFFFDERPGVDVSVTHAYRGPGHGAGQATRLDSVGTALATAVDFGVGTIVHQVGLGAGADALVPFSAWRRNDGSGDPGAVRVVQIASYVGNGGGARVITLTPASARRPLWALVIPHGAAQPFWKDAQHTGGKAHGMDGAASATAITAGGIDSITVGASLNTAAITYNVFVLVGGTTGNADGFSVDGEFIPVEPNTAPGSQWGDPPEEPVAGGGIGGSDTPGNPGGGADDMDTDLAAACKPFTTRLGDIALGKVGHSKRLVDLATDITVEAFQIRLHWAHAVKQTLRDFPWPFATRYAALTLISGSTSAPVNDDWTFSYRRPSDCIFERRIVVTRAGAVDPTPPPMGLSFDDTGGRIFTNQPAARLEYTARPACAASQGDPLFVEALTWKLAQLIAPALSRMGDREKYCQDRYDEAVFVKAPAVLKPGNPGPRPTADAQDSGTGHEAKNIEVVNRGLVRIGARTIANRLTEQSREAEAVRLIFEAELRSTLRDYAWPFATAYADTLTHVYGPVAPTLLGQVLEWSASTVYVKGDVVKRLGIVYYALLASSNQQPPNATFWTTTAVTVANADWTYAYRLPTDAVDVRRIVRAELKRRFDPAPPPFIKATDARGDLVFTDLENPTIEYTARLLGVVAKSDTLFQDALAWRFAACLAPSLAQIDPSAIEQHGRGPRQEPKERKATEAQLRARAADYAWRMYAFAISTAQATAAGDQEPQDHDGQGDPDWIRGRN